MKVKTSISQDDTVKKITKIKIEDAVNFLLIKTMLDDHVEYITINEKSHPNLTSCSPYIWRDKMKINNAMQQN